MEKHYAILYTFSYMAIGALTPLIGQYLSDMGFDGTRIGIITATGTAVAILAVAFWGRIYSMAARKVAVIQILCCGAICLGLLMPLARPFALVVALYGTMYFFQSPIMSLIDSFTVLGNIREAGSFDGASRGFGGKRAWGAVGFALGVFVAGRIVGLTGTKAIFPLYVIFYVVTLATLAAIKRKRSDRGVDTTVRDREKGYIRLLRSRKVRQLLLCMFFMGGTNVANNTYFSFLYTDGGGTLAGVGVAMLLMVGSEVPFMAWCSRLSEKFTMEKIILIAMIISSARFILYGVGLPWYVLIALFFSQGMVNGIILVEFVRYIARLAEPGLRSLAISAYYVIGSNISTIVCQVIGGLMLDSFGAVGVYMFFGLFNLTGVILYVIFGLYKENKKT